MARSLLIRSWNHCERPPVYSVTSEAATNVPFQSAPPRAARSDSSSGNDIFGALLDSNTAGDANNSAAPAPPQPAWQSLLRQRSCRREQRRIAERRPPPHQPATIPANQNASAPPAAPPPSANSDTSADAPQHFQSEVRQLEIRCRQINRKIIVRRHLRCRFFDRCHRLGAAERRDGDERHRDRDPRYRRGDGYSGCAADFHRRPPAMPRHHWRSRRQPLPPACQPLRPPLPAPAAVSSAASSAQAKIDSGAAAAVIADPPQPPWMPAAIAPDTAATAKTGVQTSTGQATATPVKPQPAAPATTATA